jgi:hypothetical protein
MSATPTRSFTRLAFAIVIAALVISASALSYASLEATVTRTVTTSGSPSSTTTLSTSTESTGPSSSSSTGTVIVPQGTTYQVQSSYDCVAGHVAQPFNVTSSSNLEGAISAGQPGVTLYVSDAQDVQDLNMGHPALWAYTSGLTNSTSFKSLLVPGSYVIWIEGADLGCGATIVTPLEQLTTVNVTQAVTLIPD